jgi:hypothetical protein
MKKPKAAEADATRGTVRLTFPWDEDRKETPEGDFIMRGGVCWPMPVEMAGIQDIQGFILMAGQNVKTKKIYVFEQKTFIVIENIREVVKEPGEEIGTEKVTYRGIVEWLNKNWCRYYGRRYYWHQPRALNKDYRLEISRCFAIQPKPSFVQIDWNDEAEAMTNIWKYVKTGRLYFDKDSELHEQLQKVKSDDKMQYPAVWALSCLVAGIERHPFRERR